MPKEKKFAFRIQENDLETLRQKAVQARLTLTDYLIACAIQKEIIVIDGLVPMLHELKRIGQNLNRLTTLSNMGKTNCVHLGETKAQLGEIFSQLSALTEVTKQWQS